MSPYQSGDEREMNARLSVDSPRPGDAPPLEVPVEGAATEPDTGDDGSPKFGRLLIVLVLAVMLIGAITLGAEAYFSH